MRKVPQPWILGVLVRAHPARFRAHYGLEILATIRDQRNAVPNATPRRLAIFWIRVVLDLARSAMREQVAEALLWPMSPTLRTIVRVSTGCILVGFAIGNVMYDVSQPKLSMGALAIVLTSLSGLVGACLLRRRRSAVP